VSTWVLLRGLMREARHWGAFPRQLGEALPGAQIVVLDLPGNGALHQSPSPTDVNAMAEHCRASLRAQALAPPYHLLALSLGGMVAVDWHQHYPNEIAGAVLLSTSMRPHNPFYRRLRPANYPALLRMALGARDPQTDERVILRITSSGPANQAVLRDWIAYARECPVSRGNALRQLWAAARFSAQPQQRAGRFLLLAGKQDRLVHPSCSADIAQAWGAELVTHPYAGHDLPLDAGPWVAAQVHDWMAKRAV
jgi:alpha-beta hydrolase superfamily lysophospholipase